MSATHTYPVSVEVAGSPNWKSDVITIHGAGTGAGPEDELNADGTGWDIRVSIPAGKDDTEYLASLARLGFESAGVEVDSDGLSTGRELVRRIEQILNFTPHPVRIIAADGTVVAEFPSVGVARAAQTDEFHGYVAGIAVVRTSFGEISGLPDSQPGKSYIVSAIAFQAALASGRNTDDLLLPSGLVRDADGNILGCGQLARVS